MKVFSLFFLVFVSLLATKTFAVDFTVNTTNDLPDTNTADGVCQTSAGDCSVRAAIQQANALASNDRILFNLPANSIITLRTANGGEIPITNNGTLDIVGISAINLTIDGGGTSRIFYTNYATVTIEGMTLTRGNGTGATASGFGGAIYALGGALTLDSVYVRANTASSYPGGVEFFNGTHNIINSTFSSNTGTYCAGFLIDSGTTLAVANSTISGNTATSNSGGGFCNLGTTTLRNVTITNNTANSGGGIYQFSGTLNFGNTIVAGNTATNNYPEIFFNAGTITSAGNNLVGNAPGRSTDTQTPITYQPTDIRDVDPKLSGLTIANGGQTPTHALQAGSPAIDTGSNALAVDPSNGTALGSDQRGAGHPRIVDGNSDGIAVVDIGAYEYQPPPTAASVSVSGKVITSRNRGIANALVRLTKQNGEIQTTRTNFFGYYTFTDLTAGETYIFEVSAKHYQFNPQVLTITEDLTKLNFTAEQQFYKAGQTIW